MQLSKLSMVENSIKSDEPVQPLLVHLTFKIRLDIIVLTSLTHKCVWQEKGQQWCHPHVPRVVVTALMTMIVTIEVSFGIPSGIQKDVNMRT